MIQNLLFGVIADNDWIFWESFRIQTKLYSDFFFGLNNFFLPRIFSEPLLWNSYFFLSKFINNIVLWDLFIVCLVLLNFHFTFELFCKFFHKNLSVLLSLIFIFSSYFLYKFTQHLSLSTLFFYPLSILFLILNTTRIRIYLKIGLLIGIAFLISNYIGYFLLIFSTLFLLIKSIFKKELIAMTTKKYPLLILTFTILVLIVAHKYIYFTVVKPTSISSVQIVNRNLEDFFTFTSRPWYYFLPSVDNPFFGGITKSAINWLQNDWGYFLTTNYFPTEHSASYLGWVNFIFALFGFRYIWRKVREQKKIATSSTPRSDEGAVWTREMDVLTLGLVAFCLAIITMPPFFTISGLKIYMPSYLLWKLFPMFRVLTRLGVIILLIELIFTGYGYMVFLDAIKKRLIDSLPAQAGSAEPQNDVEGGSRLCSNDKEKTKVKIATSSTPCNDGLSKNDVGGVKIRKIILKKWNIMSFLIILPFFILSLMEFYVPIYFTDVGTPPTVFTYIKNNTPKNAVLVTYPVNKAGDTFFWMREYQRALINPPGYNKPEVGYDFMKFTSSLITCKGILEAKNLGATYLVYYYKADKTPDISFQFYDNTNLLIKEKQFDYTDPNLKDLRWLDSYVKIIDMGNVIDNSVILYRFNDKILNCNATK